MHFKRIVTKIPKIDEPKDSGGQTYFHQTSLSASFFNHVIKLTHPFKQILVIAAMVDAIPHETEWSHVDEFYVTVKNRPLDLLRARQVPNVPWELVEEIK